MSTKRSKQGTAKGTRKGRKDGHEPRLEPVVDVKDSLEQAVALHKRGSILEAEKIYQSVLAMEPENFNALNLLGVVRSQLGDFSEAQRLMTRALEVNPTSADALNNLGNVLAERGRLDEAIDSYRRAIVASPDYSDAHGNLGIALRQQGKLDEAIEACRRAIELEPNQHKALANLILCALKLCQWKDFEDLTSRLARALRSAAHLIPPFLLFLLSSKAADLRTVSAAWSKAEFRHSPAVSFPKSRKRKSRITLGYLSADYREHVVSRQALELFRGHDRERFVVNGYSVGPDDGTGRREAIAEAFDRFVDIRQMDHKEAASTIHGDGVDILVDLTGYTRQYRTQVVTQRPAPIQVNYLGYPGTMGADFIDYIIADSYLIPPDLSQHYSESIVYLPDCYQVNPSSRPASDNFLGRSQCGLPETGFVFAAFHNSNKIGPRMFDIWMRLLRAVEGSMIWFVTVNPRVIENLHSEARERGIDPARLVFSSRQSWPDYLNFYRHGDLFLDTFPYNAGATASDALWMGCPLVTCSGETYVSRMAGSILRAMGVPELATTSLSDYESLALGLATHPDELKSIRRRINRNRETSPLFDCRRFVHHLERAYETMWETHLDGRPPHAFEVAPSDRTSFSTPVSHRFSMVDTGKVQAPPVIHKDEPQPRKAVLNVGSGNKSTAIPNHYNNWRHDLLDIKPKISPSLVPGARDLWSMPASVYDAIYCRHILERLFAYEVPEVLIGFLHVLKPDGFAEIKVPNLQAVAEHWIKNGMDIEDVLYESAVGPVSIRDMLFGFGKGIENSGDPSTAHKTGFTVRSLAGSLIKAGFHSVKIQCNWLEIRAVAFKQPPTSDQLATMGLE